MVDASLKNKTESNNYQFTAFAPNDSVLVDVPSYAQDILFQEVMLRAVCISSNLEIIVAFAHQIRTHRYSETNVNIKNQKRNTGRGQRKAKREKNKKRLSGI